MTTPQPQAQPLPNAPNAVLSLVLGIVGLFFCGGLLCPFAGGALGGRGLATAGKILGIIGTILFLLWLIVVIIALIAGTSVWFIND